MAYSDLLRDPRWQRKRLEVMQRADFSCEECGDATRTLNVHHIKYKKGRKPWEYDASELRCLCEHCHKAEHGLARKKPKPVPMQAYTLVEGPCNGQVIHSADALPLVWVYEKAGQILTAQDCQQVVPFRLDGDPRLVASHFFGRGHPYIYSTMYGPEKHAEICAHWTQPYPKLVGLYGWVPPGNHVHLFGPTAHGNTIQFQDPDMLLVHIDALINLVGMDFNESAYWNEDAV